ncbi:MAG: alkyl/aryl-sulfatase, partial [Chloroflexota bacterium]
MSQTQKEKLIAHSDEFRKEIIQITDNIWTSVGYSASNSAIIQGETGLILIDTHESTLAAEIVLAKYREIDQRPIHTIVLTHEHRDHISGAAVFAEGGSPEIISRPFKDDVMGPSELKEITRKRGERQFGIGLTTDERINIGLGPSERPIRGLAEGILPSTKFITDERETYTIDGVKMEFIHAPGETPETMVVWLPEERVLFSADNYYKSFPNLYAIRGNRYRDVQLWIDSLQKMINLNAEIMVPGHTRLAACIYALSPGANLFARSEYVRQSVVVSDSDLLLRPLFQPGSNKARNADIATQGIFNAAAAWSD